MKRRKKLPFFIFTCALVLMLAIFAALALQYRQPLPGDTQGTRTVSAVTYETGAGESGRLSLPETLYGLAPRTAVTLYAQIQAQPGESLLVKSVFAPLKLYLNDALIYEYGQEGSYPAYMNDPPTGLAIVDLPQQGGTFFLRAEYRSLTQRDTLSLSAFYVGDSAALLDSLFQANGFSLLFSLILIFLGIALALISLAFVRRLPSGMSSLWLGLFSLSAGVWIFGECDLAAFFLPSPSFLYLMDYAGLFCVTIPFLRFGLVVLNPKNRLPFRLMLGVHYISVVAAFLLQLIGLMDFTKSLYWFHIITPLGFVTFAACLALEQFKYRNPAAKRFAPAVTLLAISVVLELINYWARLTGTFTLFFQLGVLAFVVSLGILSGYYVRDSMRTAAEKKRLEYEMAAMERLLSLQRLQYMKIAENDEAVKAQRHDLRHQLTVLRSLSGQEEKLNAYMDTLMAKIPSDKLKLCENYAVNAVAAYYHAMAKQAGIDISIALTVPEELSGALESDLCVVVGNLLENAVEACTRMERGHRFIRVNSELEYGTLTLTVDNSFTGAVRKQDGVFLSSKRQGEGTGTSSVSAVAGKYGGGARFEERNSVFQASVYLRVA